MNEYLERNNDHWVLETVIRPNTFETIGRLQREARLSPVAIVGRALGIVSVTGALSLPDIHMRVSFTDGEQRAVWPVKPLPPLAEVANLAVNVSNASAQTLGEARDHGYRYGDTIDHGVYLFDTHRLAVEAGGSMECSTNGDDWYEIVFGT